MRPFLFFLALFALAPTVMASASSPPPAKADPHAAKPDPHAAKPSGEKGKDDAPPAPVGPQRHYNPGKVVEFPSFKATLVGSSEEFSYAPNKGRAMMVFFVSSWCEPCQVLMSEFKQLARKHSTASSDVIFVFAHDTKKDAEGFRKEHQIAQTAVMANIELLTSFKNPEIPSVYMSDKWGYLAERIVKLKKEDINKIDDVMSKINAL